MHWLALIVPVGFMIYGFFFKRKFWDWWEYLLVFFVPVMAILTVTAIARNTIPKSVSAESIYSQGASHYEDWDEWIKKTCSESYACGTESYSCGSGKSRSRCTRTKYCTRYYDCSYREYHPEYWEFEMSDGSTMSTGRDEYEKYCSSWGNKTFIDMHRDYYHDDGDRYQCRWNDDVMKLKVGTRGKEYENRLIATNNVMGFRKLDSLDIARYGLYGNPSDNAGGLTSGFPFILGSSDTNAYRFLSGKNGTLGHMMQMTMLMVVYYDKPSDICEVQEDYWYGGKKNELILCVNVSKSTGKAIGAKIISWTKNELLKVKVRDSILGRPKFDAYESVKILDKFAEAGWKRREFKEFEYIEVVGEITTTHVFIIWFLVIVISAAIGMWVTVNDFNNNTLSFLSGINRWLSTKGSLIDEWARRVLSKLKRK